MLPPRDDDLEIVREPLDESGADPDMDTPRWVAPRAALGGRPRGPRRRGLEALAVLGALALAVAIVLTTIRGTASQASVAPTATPAPEQVVLSSDVSFGTFTLNGTRLKGTPPLLATLRNGSNTITLTAPPFRSATCTIVWPGGKQSEGNNCGTGTGGQFIFGDQVVTPSLEVFVFLDPNDLPTQLASNAQGAIAATLDSVSLHTKVPSGDYYALQQDASGLPVARRAATTMSASLAFSLPNGQCGGPPSPCPATSPFGVPFNDEFGSSPPRNIWAITVNLGMQWTFTPPGGASLVAAPVDTGITLELWLSYDGAGGWQVMPPGNGFGPGLTIANQLSQQLCFAGTSLLQSVVTPSGQSFGTGTGGPNGSGDQGVDGCIIQLLQNTETGQPQPLGTLVWRFGALLAADAGAHKLLPTLPIAPPDELSAVTG